MRVAIKRYKLAERLLELNWASANPNHTSVLLSADSFMVWWCTELLSDCSVLGIGWGWAYQHVLARVPCQSEP